MSLFNKTPNAPVKQTIESVQMDTMKLSYRYKIAINILVFTVLGFIGGYFASTIIIQDTQSKIVNSIELSVKDQQ